MMQDVDKESMKIFDMTFGFMQLIIQHAIICFCENQATNYARKAGRIAGLIGSKMSSIVSASTSFFTP